MMIENVKASWRRLRASQPGRRFQDRYYRSQRRRVRIGWGQRILKVSAGAAICAAGLFLMPAPGPGCLVFIFGAALLSGELLWIARLLDWSELRARPAWSFTQAQWRRLSVLTKSTLVLAAASMTAAAALAAYLGWCRWG